METKVLSEISLVQIEQTIQAVGCDFYGSYLASQVYIDEVQEFMKANDVVYRPQAVLGVYFDDPKEVQAEDCRSFQGLIVDYPVDLDSPYYVFELKGKFLYSLVDERVDLGLAYDEMLAYALKENYTPVTGDGHQVMRYVDNKLSIELYFEVK